MDNIYVELEDCIEMTCFDKHGCPKPEKVYFDKQDLGLVQQYQWYTYKAAHSKAIYAQTTIRFNGKRSALRMHQLFCRCQPGQTPDHISRDGLDNRRSNLRPATQTQQVLNRGINKNSSTNVTGVYLYGIKYRAQIGFGREKEYLGTFLTIEEATEARKQAEVKYGY